MMFKCRFIYLCLTIWVTFNGFSTVWLNKSRKSKVYGCIPILAKPSIWLIVFPLQITELCGTSTPFMQAAFPSKTFPNHYTIVTVGPSQSQVSLELIDTPYSSANNLRYDHPSPPPYPSPTGSLPRVKWPRGQQHVWPRAQCLLQPVQWWKEQPRLVPGPTCEWMRRRREGRGRIEQVLLIDCF